MISFLFFAFISIDLTLLLLFLYLPRIFRQNKLTKIDANRNSYTYRIYSHISLVMLDKFSSCHCLCFRFGQRLSIFYRFVSDNSYGNA